MAEPQPSKRKIAMRWYFLRIFIPLLSLGILIFGFVLSPSPAAAQDPVPTPSDDQVNQIAKQMFCPVCENIPLDVCPTQACHDWRELIRQKIAAGWNDQQIKEYFARQYGDRVLSEPPRKGLNWLVYIAPVVLIFAGALLVGWVLRSMRRRGASQPIMPPSQPVDDPYMAQLEEELKKKNG